MTLTVEKAYVRFETAVLIRYKYLKSMGESGIVYVPIPSVFPRGIVGYLRYDVEKFTRTGKPQFMEGLRK